jgi:hypothetical protein
VSSQGTWGQKHFGSCVSDLSLHFNGSLRVLMQYKVLKRQHSGADMNNKWAVCNNIITQLTYYAAGCCNVFQEISRYKFCAHFLQSSQHPVTCTNRKVSPKAILLRLLAIVYLTSERSVNPVVTIWTTCLKSATLHSVLTSLLDYQCKRRSFS